MLLSLLFDRLIERVIEKEAFEVGEMRLSCGSFRIRVEYSTRRAEANILSPTDPSLV